MKTKPILPPTVVLIALIGMLLLHFIIPLMNIIPLPWNILGLLPLGAGVLLNLLADGLFHRAHTTVKPFQESSTLITSGVFRLSRHPMYLGFVLILAGIAVLLGSLSPWLIVPLIAIVFEVVYIRVEERMLAQKFGPDWVAYKKKVRRWV